MTHNHPEKIDDKTNGDISSDSYHNVSSLNLPALYRQEITGKKNNKHCNYFSGVVISKWYVN